MGEIPTGFITSLIGITMELVSVNGIEDTKKVAEEILDEAKTRWDLLAFAQREKLSLSQTSDNNAHVIQCEDDITSDSEQIASVEMRELPDRRSFQLDFSTKNKVDGSFVEQRSGTYRRSEVSKASEDVVRFLVNGNPNMVR